WMGGTRTRPRAWRVGQTMAPVATTPNTEPAAARTKSLRTLGEEGRDGARAVVMIGSLRKGRPAWPSALGRTRTGGAIHLPMHEPTPALRERRAPAARASRTAGFL